MSDLYITPTLVSVRFGADQIDVFSDTPVKPKILDCVGVVSRIGVSQRMAALTPDQAIQKWLAAFAPAYTVYRAPTAARQPPDIKRYLTWQLTSTNRYEQDVVHMTPASRHDDIIIDVSNHATAVLELNVYGDGGEDAIHNLLVSRHAISAIQILRAGGLSMGDVSPIRDLTELDLTDYRQRHHVEITLNRRIDGKAGIERIKEIDLGGKWVDGGTNVPDDITWKEVSP